MDCRNRLLVLTYLCLKVMNQNGTDQHTTNQEKCLAKVEDNYNIEKKSSHFTTNKYDRRATIFLWSKLSLLKLWSPRNFIILVIIPETSTTILCKLRVECRDANQNIVLIPTTDLGMDSMHFGAFFWCDTQWIRVKWTHPKEYLISLKNQYVLCIMHAPELW